MVSTLNLGIQTYKWSLGLPQGFKVSDMSFRDPSIQTLPTLGPEDCEYSLHRAIWTPRVCSISISMAKYEGLGIRCAGSVVVDASSRQGNLR